MSKPIYISFIIDQLNKGNVEWNKVFAVFCRKFPLSRKTFDKYWKLANEQHKTAQIAIQKEKDKVMLANELNGVKLAYKDKEERWAKQIEIVNQKSKKVPYKMDSKGNVIEYIVLTPSFADVQRGIDYFEKVEGGYAPIKQADTDSNGKDKERQVIKWGDIEIKL